ncbi:Hypothetical protein, putative, partial [Bodo saltans]
MGPSRRYEALGGEGGAVCSLTSQKRQHRAFSALAECQTVRNSISSKCRVSGARSLTPQAADVATLGPLQQDNSSRICSVVLIVDEGVVHDADERHIPRVIGN